MTRLKSSTASANAFFFIKAVARKRRALILDGFSASRLPQASSNESTS